MSHFRISPGMVYEELFKILDGTPYWESKGEDAEKELCYIAGATDMANAIIKRYKKGGEGNG